MEKSQPDVRDAALVMPRFAPNGSFAAQATWARADVMVEAAVASGRGVRLVHVRPGGWTMTSVDLLRDATGSLAGVDTRRARALPDGGIEARMEARGGNGVRIRRDLRVEPNGDWTSEISAVLRDGSRVTGRADRGGREEPVRFERQKTGADGVEQWSVEGQTRRDPTGSRLAGSATGSARYASGGTGKYRRVVREIDKVLVERREVSREVGSDMPSEVGEEFGGFGGGMSGLGEAFGGLGAVIGGLLGGRGGRLGGRGSRVGIVEKTNWGRGSSWSHTTGGSVMPGTMGPGSTHQQWDHGSGFEDSSGNSWTSIGRTTIDHSAPGPTGTTTTEHQWESHGPGGTTYDHSVTVTNHDNGTKSTTTSHVGTDGSTTVTTTTTDANGNGQTHTTTTDKNGNVTSDTTTPTGSGSGSGGGSGSGEGGGKHRDDAMGWEGADEGPPEIMPRHPANIFDILVDMELDAESEDPIASRIGAALKGGGALPLGDVGDAGYGEGGGRESLPDLVLVPSLASLVRVSPPTEDWGDWKDPRVHVGYAAQVVEAMTRAPGADQRALARTSVALRGLGTLIESVAAEP